MDKLLSPLVVGMLFSASPVAAHHIDNLDVPYPSRGACESYTQALSNNDYFLLDAFPEVFSSKGEVRSFLNTAFTCEQSGSDGQWYITDHRQEVLDSEWMQRRM